MEDKSTNKRPGCVAYFEYVCPPERDRDTACSVQKPPCDSFVDGVCKANHSSDKYFTKEEKRAALRAKLVELGEHHLYKDMDELIAYSHPELQVLYKQNYEMLRFFWVTARLMSVSEVDGVEVEGG